MKRTAENLSQLSACVRSMSDRIKKWPVLVSVMEGYNERSDAQNRLQHKHYTEAAKYFGWTPEYTKRFAKYNYGLPILAARENEPWWSNILQRLEGLPYEVRLEFMHSMPVTSEFTTKEAKEYIDTYMREWSQAGCVLTDPKSIDPEWYSDLEKEFKSKGALK